MQEMQIRSLGQEDPLEKEMASHSSILAWEIPWTEECPCGRGPPCRCLEAGIRAFPSGTANTPASRCRTNFHPLPWLRSRGIQVVRLLDQDPANYRHPSRLQR